MRQRTAADAQAQWWARVQWATGLVFEPDESKRSVGFDALALLATSPLAGPDDVAFLAGLSFDVLRAVQERGAVDDVDFVPVDDEGVVRAGGRGAGRRGDPVRGVRGDGCAWWPTRTAARRRRPWIVRLAATGAWRGHGLTARLRLSRPAARCRRSGASVRRACRRRARAPGTRRRAAVRPRAAARRRRGTPVPSVSRCARPAAASCARTDSSCDGGTKPTVWLRHTSTTWSPSSVAKVSSTRTGADEPRSAPVSAAASPVCSAAASPATKPSPTSAVTRPRRVNILTAPASHLVSSETRRASGVEERGPRSTTR